MPWSVYVTRPIPEAGLETLRSHCQPLDIGSGRLPLSRDELLAGVRGRDGVLCSVGQQIDEEVFRAAGPQCRVFANFGIGVDHIDLAAARRAGIIVTNTPDVLTDATADLTWALLLATARRVVEGDRLARSGNWRGWDPLELHGLDVAGKTLGIIGAGRIGTAVGLRSTGFRMQVLYVHPRTNPALEKIGGIRVSLDQSLRAADFVTLHTPLTAATHYLISQARLAMMKPSAILINTSRGAVVDEKALIAALRQKRLAGAGLDVYEQEPCIPTELASLDNVVLLPHLGSATSTARAAMARLAARNLLAVLLGDSAPNRVSA